MSIDWIKSCQRSHWWVYYSPTFRTLTSLLSQLKPPKGPTGRQRHTSRKMTTALQNRTANCTKFNIDEIWQHRYGTVSFFIIPPFSHHFHYRRRCWCEKNTVLLFSLLSPSVMANKPIYECCEVVLFIAVYFYASNCSVTLRSGSQLTFDLKHVDGHTNVLHFTSFPYFFTPSIYCPWICGPINFSENSELIIWHAARDYFIHSGTEGGGLKC